MDLRDSIELARKHAERPGSDPSARFALGEARARLAAHQYEASLFWVRRSLKHSVGIFHPDYKQVAA